MFGTLATSEQVQKATQLDRTTKVELMRRFAARSGSAFETGISIVRLTMSPDGSFVAVREQQHDALIKRTAFDLVLGNEENPFGGNDFLLAACARAQEHHGQSDDEPAHLSILFTIRRSP